MVVIVDVEVIVGVMVGVNVDVDVAVEVEVGVAATSNSYAPISQCAPCGRVTPRWSVAGQTESLAASMADEPSCNGMVCVRPP